MKKGYFLGIDTSHYSTSGALVDSEGALVANLKSLLPVKQGERGLRQSDALFAHTKNLPTLLDEAKSLASDGEILAVGVSTRPRNREGSYMPCFLAGVAAAHAAALGAGVPIYEFSHQCGHIMAALYSAGAEIPQKFAAFHISGGTTELVIARSVTGGFVCDSVGGTKDLNAGQIIDRVGVYMGYPFPSGRYMEEAALKNSKPVPKKKPTVSGTEVNLSGLENMAVKLFDQTKDKELVSAFVFNYLDAVVTMCEGCRELFGEMPFVFAGGVMSNSIIKSKLKDRFDASFAEPAMSCDNAVGIAVLTKGAYNYERKE